MNSFFKYLGITVAHRLNPKQTRHAIVMLLLGTLMPQVALTKDADISVEALLSATKTTIGQMLTYPEGQAKITAVIVSIAPGKETGWHLHNVPLFGYILEGEATVDYGADGRKTYQTGDSLLEAVDSQHNGINTSQNLTRILVVYSGAEAVANTVAEGN